MVLNLKQYKKLDKYKEGVHIESVGERENMVKHFVRNSQETNKNF